jgi:hypothetical protein
MMSLGELQISFPLFFVPKIHLMISYFDSEKVDQDEVFNYKDTFTFLLRMTQILHIPKIIFGNSRTFMEKFSKIAI